MSSSKKSKKAAGLGESPPTILGKRVRKQVDYSEDKLALDAASTPPKIPQPPQAEILKQKMAGIPKRNTAGQLCFDDFPNFRPNLTPKEVLQLGSFGGTYFRPIFSRVTGKSYSDEMWKELPKDWLEGLNIPKQVASSTYRKSVNTYKEECGGDLDMWESSGWISAIDPYGWFQWYCRFYQGRRSTDDERQISRGNGVMGPTGRWRNALINKILARSTAREVAVNDVSISPKIRQLLQHWGYAVTVKDVEAAAKQKGIK